MEILSDHICWLVYRDYFNNYLTVRGFADSKRLDFNTAKKIIEKGFIVEDKLYKNGYFKNSGKITRM